MDFRERIKINNIYNNNEFYKVYNKSGMQVGIIEVKDERKLNDSTFLKEKGFNEEVFLRGVTCFVINEHGEVLVEQRANTELTPGKRDIVSGHVNGNEHGFQAMARELREEVGIDCIEYTDIIKLNEQSKPLYFESRGQIRNFLIDFYCLFIKAEQVKEFQKEEVKSLRWVPMELAFDMLRAGRMKFPKKEVGKVSYETIINQVRKEYTQKSSKNRSDEKKVMEK